MIPRSKKTAEETTKREHHNRQPPPPRLPAAQILALDLLECCISPLVWLLSQEAYRILFNTFYLLLLPRFEEMSMCVSCEKIKDDQ